MREAGYLFGPLHGVPVALKDLVELEGRRTSGGAAQWRERISPVTATVVDRLTAAGAIILGKTHMVELAFGGWGTNASMGTPRNPWGRATARSPGGSSSGSGVAVAAGLVPAALGSDTGGSVRIPASFCGIVGLKTTVGRVSNHGTMALASTFDTIGPMTRSVEDAAILCSVLAGPDLHDPATRGLARPDVLTGLKEGVAGLRLGVLDEADREPVDAEILAAYDEALQVLERQGAELVRMALPMSFADYQACSTIIMIAEGYALHSDWIGDPDIAMDPHVRTRILAGKDISADAYLRALAARGEAKRAFLASVEGLDALLTPSTPNAAVPLNALDETSSAPSRFTRMVNYLDLCALALPNGVTGEGMPTSLQIIGRSYDEAMALRVGWAFEHATPWHRRHPAL
jgi:aspartyl-tRNA(Asn)/glutamyl-tRNA(Gln) amidotransferase subunit A